MIEGSIHEKTNSLLLRLPKEVLINVFYDALEEMQSYNGRSPHECIVTALGGVYDSDQSPARFKLPTFEQTIKRFNHE